MADSTQIALVGTGNRGRALLSAAYQIHEISFLSEDDNPTAALSEIYSEHALTTPSWLAEEDVSDLAIEITALVDPSADARTEAMDLCRTHGDNPAEYASVTDLPTADLDAAIVASPNNTHVDIIFELMGEDVGIFSEKPVAVEFDDYDRLIDAVERTGTDFYVGFNLRSSPVYAAMKELIDAGVVGDLGMMTAHNVRVPFPGGFRFSREESGGALLEKNCHDFDLYNWYAESDPIRVSAIGGQHVYTENTDIVDHAYVTIEYENGVRGALELCLYAPFKQGPPSRRIMVRGSEGMLEQLESSTGIDVYSRNEHKTVDAGRFPGGHAGADGPQIATFLRYLDSKDTPTATLEDAKTAAAVALAAQRAIDEQRTVSLDEL